MNNVVEMNPKERRDVPTSNLLLELFLDYDFWKDHNHMISKDYFENESRKIYDTICLAHEKLAHGS